MGLVLHGSNRRSSSHPNTHVQPIRQNPPSPSARRPSRGQCSCHMPPMTYFRPGCQSNQSRISLRSGKGVRPRHPNSHHRFAMLLQIHIFSLGQFPYGRPTDRPHIRSGNTSTTILIRHLPYKPAPVTSVAKPLWTTLRRSLGSRWACLLPLFCVSRSLSPYPSLAPPPTPPPPPPPPPTPPPPTYVDPRPSVSCPGCFVPFLGARLPRLDLGHTSVAR